MGQGSYHPTLKFKPKCELSLTHALQHERKENLSPSLQGQLRLEKAEGPKQAQLGELVLAGSADGFPGCVRQPGADRVSQASQHSGAQGAQ